MRTAVTSRAMSIVEVVVALALLAVGLYGVVDLLGSSQRTARMADVNMQLASLGHLKLEELRANPAGLQALLANPPSGEGTIVYPAEGPKPFDQHPAYRWQAALRRLAEPAGQVEIRVDVTANRPGTTPKPYQIRGMVFVPHAKEGAQ